MKNIFLIPLIFFFITSVSAEENRNQYSNSIMLKDASKTVEDTNHKSEVELHNQHCLDLQKRIKDLKYRPVRRNAANERYKLECINK